MYMYQIKAPHGINGINIALPASKSLTNRALLLNALSGNRCHVANMADCDDSRLLLAALQSNATTKDLGAAGTALRFSTAYYAMMPGVWVITGSERMKKRPIGILVEALRQLGADIEYLGQEGYPPLRVTGHPLRGGQVCIDGSVSSQFLSALMMIAPLMEQGLCMKLENTLNSRPYLDMTADMMRHFGVYIRWKGREIIIPSRPYEPPRQYSIEADWSAASYWYETLSLYSQGRLLLRCLRRESLQGDARVADWFAQLGVRTTFGAEGCLLESVPTASRYFIEDFRHQPDLAQTFAVTLALKGIPFHLKGLESLRIKETDRLSALVCEMGKLGYEFIIKGDDLIWKGRRTDPGKAQVVIDTYEDHRMAMAFAPASVVSDVPLVIRHPEVVGKSYPDFWQHLLQAGFDLKEI